MNISCASRWEIHNESSQHQTDSQADREQDVWQCCVVYSLVPVEVEASDSGGVAVQDVVALASVSVPHPQHPVSAAAHYQVARHLGWPNAARVSRQGPHALQRSLCELKVWCLRYSDIMIYEWVVVLKDHSSPQTFVEEIHITKARVSVWSTDWCSFLISTKKQRHSLSYLARSGIPDLQGIVIRAGDNGVPREL